jgi:hypothetical protein
VVMRKILLYFIGQSILPAARMSLCSPSPYQSFPGTAPGIIGPGKIVQNIPAD